MTKRRAPKNLWTTGKSPRDAVTLEHFACTMERIAPAHLAEAWDNVGLLSGHRTSLVKKVLLTIDLTPAVHDEAIANNIDLVLSYHPPIFKPLKHLRINGDEPPALAVALASYGIWCYSPHTALDTATGGTNDTLAQKLGAKVTGSFSQYAARGEYLKLVTFIPHDHVEQVAEAIFAAGAGHIGQKAKYAKCSFRVEGTGTFMGDDSANPTVGQRNVYEHVKEMRFETILPANAAGDVVNALMQSHPYEEPAYDLLKMQTPPEAVGLGRYAAFDHPLTLAALAQRAKRTLKLPHVLVAGDTSRRIERIAVVAGSAGRIALDQATNPYDCLVTGELKHHDVLAYAAGGKSVLCLGHAASERPVLDTLTAQLAELLPTLDLRISQHPVELLQLG